MSADAASFNVRLVLRRRQVVQADPSEHEPVPELDFDQSADA